MKFERLALIIAWVLALLLYGCSPTRQGMTQIAVGLSTSNPTVTLINSITPFILNSTSTKSPTQTQIPTNTPIPSPMSRNTPIPIQNLELEEAKQRIDFLSGGSNCQPPCFNGLTPGISSVWDVQGFFATLGLTDESLTDNNGYLISKDAQGFWILNPSQGSVGKPVPYLLTSNFSDKPFIGVEWNDSLVTNITLGPLPYRTWVSIPRLYQRLGKPDAIKIALDAGEGNKFAFILDLYFSTYETYIEYIILGTSLTDVCLNSDTPADTFAAIGLPLLPYSDYGLRNWHELNGMNFDDLVNKVGTGDFCIPSVAAK
jgi:hypothetical protein